MIKVLLYDNKIFANARSFYEYIIEENKHTDNWNLNYVAVAFTYKLKTISSIKVEWVTLNEEAYQELLKDSLGVAEWVEGADESFVEYVLLKDKEFNRETLWRWAVDYVAKYDLPRSRMKRYVDEVMTGASTVEKKNGVYNYTLNRIGENNEKDN